MHHMANLAAFMATVAYPVATITKHDLAGIVVVLVAVALVGLGVARLAAKAAGALMFVILGVAAVVLAVLLFSRAI